MTINNLDNVTSTDVPFQVSGIDALEEWHETKTTEDESDSGSSEHKISSDV